MGKIALKSGLASLLAALGLLGVSAAAFADASDTSVISASQSAAVVRASSDPGSISQTNSSDTTVISQDSTDTLSQTSTQSLDSTGQVVTTSNNSESSGGSDGSNSGAKIASGGQVVQSDQLITSPVGGSSQPASGNNQSSVGGGSTVLNQASTSRVPLELIASQMSHYARVTNEATDNASKPVPIVPVASPTGEPHAPLLPPAALGLLQQITAAVANGFVGIILAAGTFSVGAPGALPVAADPMVKLLILILTAAGVAGSAYIRWLRTSGYSGAARSDATAAPSLFATPLKMSCIGLHGY